MIRTRLPALIERRRVRGIETVGAAGLAGIPAAGQGDMICGWELSTPFAAAGLEDITALAWDTAGARIAIAHSGGVSVYAYPSGAHVATSTEGAATSLAWVSDTRIVGIGGYGNGMTAYDLPAMDYTLLQVYDNWFGDLSASEDGLYYAARAYGGASLSIYDAQTLESIDHGIELTHVAGLAWSGPILYVLGRTAYSGPLAIWSITPGDWDIDAVSGGPELADPWWWLAQMAFSQDGAFVAIGGAGAEDSGGAGGGVTIRVYSVPGWAEVAAIPAGDKCLDLSWDPAGAFLSAATSTGDPPDYSVRIYSRAAGYSEETVPVMDGLVPMAAFSPSQTALAVGASDGGPLILTRRCGRQDRI